MEDNLNKTFVETTGDSPRTAVRKVDVLDYKSEKINTDDHENKNFCSNTYPILPGCFNRFLST